MNYTCLVIKNWKCVMPAAVSPVYLNVSFEVPTPSSKVKVMRITKLITKGRMLWS